MLEIDTRIIEGNGGELTWTLDGRTHVVTLANPALDAPWIVYRGSSGITAREAFRHPFSSSRTPDVFARVIEPELVA